MFGSTFWKKYLFRMIKIVTLVILCHQVINAKVLGTDPKHLRTFYTINNLICISAGAINMYLLRTNLMGNKKQGWMIFHHIKLVSSILLFTPLIKLLPFSKGFKLNLQFYWIVAALILAPMMRYYRQYSMMRERERKEKEQTE